MPWVRLGGVGLSNCSTERAGSATENHKPALSDSCAGSVFAACQSVVGGSVHEQVGSDDQCSDASREDETFGHGVTW